MDEQRQEDQQEHIYNSSVFLQEVFLKTSPEQWTIGMGGMRGSVRSVLAVQHDDDEIHEMLQVGNETRLTVI